MNKTFFFDKKKSLHSKYLKVGIVIFSTDTSNLVFKMEFLPRLQLPADQMS